MSILTREQKLLTRYLATTEMDLVTRLLISGMLWEEEATLEMLQYIARTQETDPAKLYSVALEISQKYPTEPEQA